MRSAGYAAIEDYALVGDGRTAALVAKDGSIDWLCLPNFDSPSVFAAALDAERGGSFELRPEIPGRSSRRYLPGTNVLETVWTTDRGTVRVIDAMTLPGGGLAPLREIVRRIEGMSGRVPVMWRVSPRFDYGASLPRTGWRGSVPVASHGPSAIAVPSWHAGTPAWQGPTLSASVEISEGHSATVALVSSHTEPLVIPGRSEIDRRLAETIAFWQRWTGQLQYDGPWAEP